MRNTPEHGAEPSPLAVAFSDLILRLSTNENAVTIRDTLQNLVDHIRDGHSCLDLAVAAAHHTSINALLARSAWPSELLRPGLIVEPAQSGPVVLDGHRLYTRQTWRQENELATWLRAHVRQQCAPIASPLQDKSLNPEQRKAAEAMFSTPLSLIAGGPGTGKTHTLASALAHAVESEAVDPEKVFLAAPTGKAAARLREAITCTPLLEDKLELQACLARNCTTVHRFLGWHAASRKPRYNRTQPHPALWLVIDEAGMLDMGIAHALFKALASECRIVLMGDPNQLASVESGAVFNDLVSAAREPAAFPAALHRLKQVHRFASDTPIAVFCRAIAEGKIDQALAAVGKSTLQRIDLPHQPGRDGRLHTVLREAQSSDRERPQILTLLRRGPCGSETFNTHLLAELRPGAHGRKLDSLPPGTPIVLERNDYRLDLANGDTGIVTETGREVEFADLTDGKRRIPLALLETWSPAYALTVHKSQGSEYRHVHLILPPAPHPLLTREALYTAISRARDSVRIWGDGASLRYALGRPTQRHSGLCERLTRP